MATLTPNYQFTLPAVNNAIDANIWGGEINNDWSLNDAYISLINSANIGSTAPVVPATAAPTAGMMWLNNTTGVNGTWPLSIYDGTAWVTVGMLNTEDHIYANVGNVALNVQKFTTTGLQTYTPSLGMSYCIVECVGAGGGGGGLTGAGASPLVTYAAGGGGGGGYAKQIFTIGQIGASQPVFVGTGGTASSIAGGNGGASLFGTAGALLNCTGGIGGSGLNAIVANSNFALLAGGAGGTSSGALGYENISGNPGDNGIAQFTGTLTPFAIGGNGGGCPLGGTVIGPRFTTAPNGGAGINGSTTGYGSGGSGAAVLNNGLVSSLGGIGANGAIIITEYI